MDYRPVVNVTLDVWPTHDTFAEIEVRVNKRCVILYSFYWHPVDATWRVEAETVHAMHEHLEVSHSDVKYMLENASKYALAHDDDYDNRYNAQRIFSLFQRTTEPCAASPDASAAQ